jgi:hypothetical protein
MASISAIETDWGPSIAHYAIPLDQPHLYRWIPGDTTTANSETVLSYSGGTVGRWHRVRVQQLGANLTNADATLYASGKRWRILPAATLTANHVATLSTTGAAAGDELTITRLDVTANTYAVVNGGAGAGTLITMPVSVRYFADFYFDGTNWRLMRAGQMA